MGKSKSQLQKEQLEAFSAQLKDKGFLVIVSAKHPFKWVIFEKEGNLGNVSPGSFFNFNFGTNHKSNKKFGTGFSTFREVELELELAEKTMQHSANKVGSNVERYKDAADFISASENTWAEYYIL